jgi:hypothetical protein
MCSRFRRRAALNQDWIVSKSRAYTMKTGQQQVKEAVLQDIDDYMHTRSGDTESKLQLWLDDALARYSAWLERTGSR